MILPLLCVLPFLFNGINGQGEDKESAGCRYSLYKERYRRGTLVHQELKIESFDECLKECINYNSHLEPFTKACSSISYFPRAKDCNMYPMNPGEKESELFYEHNGAVSAIIKTCLGSPPPTAPTKPVVVTTKAPPPTQQPPISGPIGCGAQDGQYMPSLAGNVRILQGRETVPHSWPWQISLIKNGYWHSCGATLLRVRNDREESDMILTAGHCFNRYSDGKPNFENTEAKAGKHVYGKFDQGEQSRKIVAAKYHEAYFNHHRDDILIARLESPIRFTKTIRPICMPAQDEPLPMGRKCYATGWGRIDPKQQYVLADQLRQASMSANSDDVCFRAWGYGYQKNSHVCAGNGVSTICQGDSGGPLVCQGSDNRWTQYGISSFVAGGSTCTHPQMPAMFTRVSSFANWIQKNVREMSALA